jgi:putative methionine-R-sulfoxide reductase with GAF domain
MRDRAATLEKIDLALESAEPRPARLKRAAEAMREAGGYRWVGIYDVEKGEIAIVAWSGPGEPANPRFPVAQGLCGDAVRRGEIVLVGDVRKDPRYLTTFETTRSEIVVPILDPGTGRAIGTIDVESERIEAFSGEDRSFLERCAARLASSWPRET